VCVCVREREKERERKFSSVCCRIFSCARLSSPSMCVYACVCVCVCACVRACVLKSSPINLP